MSENSTNGAGTPEGDTDGSQVPGGAASSDETAEAAADPAARIAQLEKEVGEVKDRFLRNAADFENFRKRSRREVEEAVRGAKESMLRDFLPVIDNLERAMSAVQGPIANGTAPAEVASLAKGVELVLKLFNDTLGRYGVRGFVSKGSPFDPQLHEAIQQVETSSHPAGTVIEEFQKGYMLNDRLVRPAMVVVAKEPEGAVAGDGAGREPNGAGGDAG
jgi:molecular chaperone GrpE